MNIKVSSLLLLSLLLGSNAAAHPVGDHPQPNRSELASDSSADDDMVTIGGFTGPRDTTGVSSIETLGIIDLGDEFRHMKCREMRAREFTIEPGGVIGIHAHEQRPGYAFIISGTIVEHRNDQSGPVVRIPGDVSMEQSGVIHWWENVSSEPVKALVVDIFTQQSPSFRRCPH